MSATIHMVGIVNNYPTGAVFDCDSKALRQALEERGPSAFKVNEVGAIKLKTSDGYDNPVMVGGDECIQTFLRFLEEDAQVKYHPDCQAMARTIRANPNTKTWWFFIDW